MREYYHITHKKKLSPEEIELETLANDIIEVEKEDLIKGMIVKLDKTLKKDCQKTALKITPKTA